MRSSARLHRKEASLYETLRRSRNTLFHYPVMHPEKERAGAEELANALDAAKDLDGWIEDGGHYATFRATFADTVALRFLTGSEEETVELADQMVLTQAASREGDVFDFDEVFAKADQALYEAKRAGRNCVCTPAPELAAEPLPAAPHSAGD